MNHVIIFSLTLLLLCMPAYAHGQPLSEKESASPVLTVRGSGEVSAPPDQAVVALGADAQNENAAEAQKQVNRIVGAILSALKAVGISEETTSTTQLALVPVYERTDRVAAEPGKLPRIVGYRANHVVRVEIDQVNKVGDVIDAGIGAGANRLEGLSFELKDDAPFRKEALRRAVVNAREKAEGIAKTLNLRIVGVLEIFEEGIHMVQPRFQLQRMVSAAADSTPVEPGRIQVNASVVIRYQIGDTGSSTARP